MPIDRKEFASQKEIYEFFSALREDEEDDTKHNERQEKKELYCIEKYLTTLALHKKLSYPVHIEKSEAPDFIVRYGVYDVGLEITEATSQEYQRWLTSISDSNGVHAFNKTGYFGSDPEADCAQLVVESVQRKEAKLEDYKRNHPSVFLYDLLIYDGSHGIIDSKGLFEILSRRLQNISSEFRIISVISGGTLLYRVNKDGEMLDIPD